MPLCIATVDVTPTRLDELLAAGYRRSGWFYYRTRCPNCSACEPLRVPVSQFEPSRSQRRARKLGDRHLRVEWGPPLVDAERVSLFNKHRRQRNLGEDRRPVSAADYQSFLVNATCNIAELRLWYEEKLVAVSITDMGANSLSAVYCFFDPDHAWLGLGNYAILQQIEQARQPRNSGLRSAREWLYLGLFVSQNRHLNYKANYQPHERLVNGEWKRFQRD